MMPLSFLLLVDFHLGDRLLISVYTVTVFISSEIS